MKHKTPMGSETNPCEWKVEGGEHLRGEHDDECLHSMRQFFFEMFGAFVMSVSVFQSCVHWVDDLFFFYPFSCFLVARWCVFLV